MKGGGEPLPPALANLKIPTRPMLVKFCSFLLLVSTLACAAADRPNILFIQTDDQGPWGLGLVNPEAKTPNLDRIFKSGAWLKNSCTVTPVCSPSRAATMTSRYGSEVGVTDWINPKEAKGGMGIDPVKFKSWPALLQEAGYATGLVGKWHNGETPDKHPAKQGYGFFFGFLGGGCSTMNPTFEQEGKDVKFTGYTEDILADQVIKFVRSHKDAPFALSWHTRAPHAPYAPVPPEDMAPFANLDPSIPQPPHPDLKVAEMKKLMREYLASIHSVDRNVGRVMDVLKELGLTEKTMVIFTSDHGYNLGHHGLRHKGNATWLTQNPPAGTPNVPKGQRPNMFETSLHMPTAVSWPAGIKPGTEVRELVSNLDWLPTLLDAAGVKKPDSMVIRGRSFLPLLKGETVPGWPTEFYAEYSIHNNGPHTAMRTWRTEKWKLTLDFLNPERSELCNVGDDALETKNVIDDPRPEVQAAKKELEGKIRAKMKELGDTTGDKPAAP